MRQTTGNDMAERGTCTGRRSGQPAARIIGGRQAAEIVLGALPTLLACGSSLLLVFGATGCSASEDLSPSDGGDHGDALGDDGTAPEGSCSAVECTATCRAAGYPDGTCRGAVCRCGSPEGCTLGETTSCYSGPAGTAGVGACVMGAATCVGAAGEFGEWGPCEGEGRPAAEVCNEIDDDCDGFPDEDLGCIPPGEPCSEGDICLEGQRCIEFPSGRQVCDDSDPCSGPTSWGECETWEDCVEFPDHTWNCYDQPRSTCQAHFWFDEGGSHLDSCSRCHILGYENGSMCTATPSGGDLLLDCQAALGLDARRNSGGLATDFIAMDLPFQNPVEIRRCLVAWGVHRLVGIAEGTAGGSVPSAATARIAGGASGTMPLERDGLRTILPAAAFQHVFVEPPPLPTVPIPTTKEERTARVFWEEPSAADCRTDPLDVPYTMCDTCVTYEDLINHMYPGPEIFCQGLPRDPADSEFVVPFWMPYYDALLGTQNHFIASEMVCEYPSGEVVHSVTAFFLPYTWPASLPAVYP